ncbi:unnamed protein product, partial [Amoebophrya sp. A25]
HQVDTTAESFSDATEELELSADDVPIARGEASAPIFRRQSGSFGSGGSSWFQPQLKSR